MDAEELVKRFNSLKPNQKLLAALSAFLLIVIIAAPGSFLFFLAVSVFIFLRFSSGSKKAVKGDASKSKEIKPYIPEKITTPISSRGGVTDAAQAYKSGKISQISNLKRYLQRIDAMKRNAERFKNVETDSPWSRFVSEKDYRSLEQGIISQYKADQQFSGASLVAIGDNQAIQILLTALKNADTGISVNAAQALAAIGEPAITPLIDELIHGLTSKPIISAALVYHREKISDELLIAARDPLVQSNEEVMGWMNYLTEASVAPDSYQTLSKSLDSCEGKACFDAVLGLVALGNQGLNCIFETLFSALIAKNRVHSVDIAKGLILAHKKNMLMPEQNALVAKAIIDIIRTFGMDLRDEDYKMFGREYFTGNLDAVNPLIDALVEIKGSGYFDIHVLLCTMGRPALPILQERPQLSDSSGRIKDVIKNISASPG